MSWQPSANWQVAKQRAALFTKIRSFFAKREVVEVDTPLLCQHTVTDLHLEPFASIFNHSDNGQVEMYLQTSPEYAMKRLLASGYGDIFQICKSFRNESHGRFHNPEFTMLEWYRKGFNHSQLIAEVAALLEEMLGTDSHNVYTYQELFLMYTSIDPLNTDLEECKSFINAHGKYSDWLHEERSLDTLLQFIFCEFIESSIDPSIPCFVELFPASQASLAVINESDSRVANRFECYYQGIELANGFEELTNSEEQIKRFEQDNQFRALNGLRQQIIDSAFISALKSGLPHCSGVALGLDRLLMLATGSSHIDDVISFPVYKA